MPDDLARNAQLEWWADWKGRQGAMPIAANARSERGFLASERGARAATASSTRRMEGAAPKDRVGRKSSAALGPQRRS